MSTVIHMAYLPFEFPDGNDFSRDKNKDEHNSEFNENNSGSTPNPNPYNFNISGSHFDMGTLGQVFTKLGEMFSGIDSSTTHSNKQTGSVKHGFVNYDLAKQLAYSCVTSSSPTSEKINETVINSVRTAETWLDCVTALPTGIIRSFAWTPKDWLDNTFATWQRLCDPVVQQIASVWTSIIPDNSSNHLDKTFIVTLISQMGSMAFGSQLGQSLGKLSNEVLSSTDIGLLLGPSSIASLMPTAIESLSKDLEQPKSEMFTFLAAREAAHHRIFNYASWLPGQLIRTIETFAKGIRIDSSNIENFINGFNPILLNESSEMEQLLKRGIFRTEVTSEQKLTLERLETLLALIEGWVQNIVTAALKDRIPGTYALSEMLHRRRATGGPAEQTFSTLVGLELRPRKIHEATLLWKRLTDEVGINSRDKIWQHPDMLPRFNDLDEPADFIKNTINRDKYSIKNSFEETITNLEKENNDEDPKIN